MCEVCNSPDCSSSRYFHGLRQTEASEYVYVFRFNSQALRALESVSSHHSPSAGSEQLSTALRAVAADAQDNGSAAPALESVGWDGTFFGFQRCPKMVRALMAQVTVDQSFKI